MLCTLIGQSKQKLIELGIGEEFRITKLTLIQINVFRTLLNSYTLPSVDFQNEKRNSLAVATSLFLKGFSFL